MSLSRWCLLLLMVGLLTPLLWADSQRGLADYRALADEQRAQLIKFTSDWADLDSDTRTRLKKVMLRYADWLARLTPAERQSIDAAPTIQRKLLRIRQLRDKQWLATLPKPDRDMIEAAKTEDERRKALADIRRGEQQRDLAWQLAMIRGEDQKNFNQQFQQWQKAIENKSLSIEERQRFEAARTQKNGALMRALVELSRKYHVPIPPLVEKRIKLLGGMPPVSIDKLTDYLRKAPLDEMMRQDFETRLKSNDPLEHEQVIVELTRLYWSEHTDELHKMREAERRAKTMNK